MVWSLTLSITSLLFYKLGLDLCEQNGKLYLIAVDYLINWLEKNTKVYVYCYQ